MSRLPSLFNFFLRSSLFQRVFGRLAGLVDTPLLARRSLPQLLRARARALLPGATPAPAGDRPRVVIVQDAFTSFYEPELVLAVRDLL